MLITTVTSDSCPDVIRPTAPTRWPERTLVKPLHFLQLRCAPRPFIYPTCLNELPWDQPSGRKRKVKTGNLISTAIRLDEASTMLLGLC
jgi:hypothetical protein